MKRVGLALLLLAACDEKEPLVAEFTGNEVVYDLQAGSTYPTFGTLTIKEKKDGGSVIIATLSGTEGELQHPVHLHLGDISMPDAEIAALLTPLTGSTGESKTTLSTLADETTISYAQLRTLHACVKIHLAESGPGRDIILAAGNIGSAVQSPSNARMGIAVCK
jgi:hypothetical protein